MENYTKYALKSWEELSDLLEGKDNLFVVACNKCFKEFDTTQEPELEQFLKLAEGLDKTVVGTAKADFLCNETKATKGLPAMIPENAEHVVVISCGPSQAQNSVFASLMASAVCSLEFPML